MNGAGIPCEILVTAKKRLAKGNLLEGLFRTRWITGSFRAYKVYEAGCPFRHIRASIFSSVRKRNRIKIFGILCLLTPFARNSVKLSLSFCSILNRRRERE